MGLLNRLFSALSPDFVLTLVDVGSAGGLHRRWRPFQPILSAVLFDPREPAPSGRLGRGQTRIYPVALSNRAGQADLYITALPNMSSFLKPDAKTFGQYRKKGRDAEIVSTEDVRVDTLDSLAAADGFKPTVLKIDTQGSELMVLEGALQSLRSVVLAEVEVSFLQRYVRQPLLGDIQEWMAKQDFELFELDGVKRYRAANSLGIRHNLLGGWQRSGRAAYGDALFVRRIDSILDIAAKDGGTSLQAAVVGLLAYGKADHAAALLDQGRGLLPPEQLQALRSALSALHRRRSLAELSGLVSRLRGR
jgi:FkbM family methyltransferase